ncbi:ABC transporter substrate-binding protein [Caldalkalibacillus mannanilyticus]|uniref:ABC transporter substrate-binding protein n=1 Tax=Caldalkalibacillus mannanilyticus TaxID=1418 RepID=UPI000468E7B1
MKRFVLLYSILLLLIFTLVACSAASNSSEAPEQPDSKTEQEEAIDQKEEKKETKDPGKLLVYTAGPKGMAEELLQGFMDQTGIEAEMFQGTTGAILGRIEAESSNPLADVVILASWPAAKDLKNKDLLFAYPEAKDADKLHKGWNEEDYFFGYSASALGITYNTQLVQNPGKDWSDYTLAEWKDEVNIPDPSLSGSSLDFVAGYLSNHPDQGWELFEKLRANKVQVAGANKEALDPVIIGAKRAVLAGVDYMAYSAKAKGEPIDILYPTSGTVVNPRPAMILKSAKNLENAKLFIDYLLSDEAQKIIANAYLLPGRSDIPAHPDRVDYQEIPQLPIDWDWMSQHQEKINEKFQELMR